MSRGDGICLLNRSSKIEFSPEKSGREIWGFEISREGSGLGHCLMSGNWFMSGYRELFLHYREDFSNTEC